MDDRTIFGVCRCYDEHVILLESALDRIRCIDSSCEDDEVMKALCIDVFQIIAWPLGHGMAKFLPNHQYNTFGLRWNLNPGPFNVKEHSIIVVMASVSFSAAYATDILLAQIAFYKQDFGLVFQCLLVVSTQSIGYGIAGMLRKYLGMCL